MFKKLPFQHQYLQKIFGFSSIKIIYEYIFGKKLDNVDLNNFTLDEKVSMIFEIMISVETLHINDFLHRYIEPSKIIIDSNKSAVLVCLSYSRLLEHSQALTSNLGGGGYTAPEQNQTNKYSFPADVFSIYKVIK